MFFNPRIIGIKIAILCFFIFGVIGMICRHNPVTCTKRTLIASLAAYVITVLAVRGINVILLDALSQSEAEHTDQPDESVYNTESTPEEETEVE